MHCEYRYKSNRDQDLNGAPHIDADLNARSCAFDASSKLSTDFLKFDLVIYVSQVLIPKLQIDGGCLNT